MTDRLYRQKAIYVLILTIHNFTKYVEQEMESRENADIIARVTLNALIELGVTDYEIDEAIKEIIQGG